MQQIKPYIIGGLVVAVIAGLVFGYFKGADWYDSQLDKQFQKGQQTAFTSDLEQVISGYKAGSLTLHSATSTVIFYSDWAVKQYVDSLSTTTKK